MNNNLEFANTVKKRRGRKITILKIILPVVFWSFVGAIVYFAAPESHFVIAGFFVLLAIALFTTTRLFTISLTFNLSATLLVILALILRYLKLGSPFNLTLIGLILILLFLYLRAK